VEVYLEHSHRAKPEMRSRQPAQQTLSIIQLKYAGDSTAAINDHQKMPISHKK